MLRTAKTEERYERKQIERSPYHSDEMHNRLQQMSRLCATSESYTDPKESPTLHPEAKRKGACGAGLVLPIAVTSAAWVGAADVSKLGEGGYGGRVSIRVNRN